MSEDSLLAAELDSAVSKWLEWLPFWEPPSYKVRQRICRKCTGSPIVLAAGLNAGVPHQVVHAFVTKMHKVLDKNLDQYTADFLPVLSAELEGTKIWKSGQYDPLLGLPDEVAGEDIDLVIEEGDHPVLFTFEEFEAQSVDTHPVLPRPPLSREEKDQLRKEMGLADQRANELGQEICFLLADRRETVVTAVMQHVEPKINSLLEELSRSLEHPLN